MDTAFMPRNLFAQSLTTIPTRNSDPNIAMSQVNTLDVIDHNKQPYDLNIYDRTEHTDLTPL